MKYWLSQLPLEVWVDCYRYPGITREQMGQIVDLIGNRTYGEYLQFYLHDWGKRELKPIFFYQRPFKPIPQTPMPNNIRSFQFIQIKHLNQQTIDFLHRIQPLLLADTKMELRGIQSWNLNTLRIILDHMLPLLGTIDSLKCNMLALPTVQQCLGNEKLSKINAIEAESYELNEAMRQATINFLMNCLAPAQQDRDSIVPKWCKVNLFNDNGFSAHICAAIRKDFLAAKSPSMFALFVHPRYSQWHFAEFHLQNGIREELHGVRTWRKSFQITRHKANCGAEMEAWIKANQSKSCDQKRIYIQSPTIGVIDAMDAPKNEDSDPKQPSTSTKA